MSDSVSLTSKTSSAGRRCPSGLIGWSFTSFFSSRFDWSRPRSQDTGRRENKFIAVNAKTISSSWLRASAAECTSPRSGLERDARASATVTRMRRRSPGRTGRVQRSSSRPGWPHGKCSGRRRDACKRQWCAHSWQSPRGTGPSPTTPGPCGSTAGRSPGPSGHLRLAQTRVTELVDGCWYVVLEPPVAGRRREVDLPEQTGHDRA